MKITKKLLEAVIDGWNGSTADIMDSQKKYNEAALEWCRARMERWLGEYI